MNVRSLALVASVALTAPSAASAQRTPSTTRPPAPSGISLLERVASRYTFVGGVELELTETMLGAGPNAQPLRGVVRAYGQSDVRVGYNDGRVRAFDGVTGWIYEPARRTLTCTAPELALPSDGLLFLSGSMDPMKSYTVRADPLAATQGTPSRTQLTFEPSVPGITMRMRLLVEQDSLHVGAIAVEVSGSLHVLYLRETRTGLVSPANPFRASVPLGTTITRAPGWTGPC